MTSQQRAIRGHAVTSLDVAIAVPVALAVIALGFVATGGAEPGPPTRLADVLGWGALVVVVLYPALVAVAAGDGCPRLRIACAVSCVPRMFLSFSLLFVPLFLPAVIFFARATACDRHRWGRHVAVNALLIALGVAAIVALFVNVDPVSYTFTERDPATGEIISHGSGSVSNSISALEALLSLTLSGLGVLAARLASLPTRPRARAHHPS
jgi:hypothetical protein